MFSFVKCYLMSCRHSSSVVLALFLCAVLADAQWVVNTTQGAYRATCDNNACVFKGIRYAKSTEGAMRWTRAVPPDAHSSIVDADNYPPICPQRAPWPLPIPEDTPTSEDCLFLNVFAPAPSSERNKYDNSLKPVLFWIHGGGFMQGYSADPVYRGNFFANTSDIVMVSANYRLGALGFLNSGGAAGDVLQGNYGFSDQILALEWVQRNIANFGGDPSRVTIQGQSAGAMSVMIHLVSPMSSNKGLFSGAILESNLASVLYRTPEENTAYADTLASHLHCGSPSNISCLRSASVEDIIAADVVPEYLPNLHLPLSTSMFLAWCPALDGKYLTGQPLSLIEQGMFQKNTPILMGTVRNETSRFIPYYQFGNLAYEGLVKAWFSTNASLVLAEYPPDRRNSRDQFDILSTDYLFNCPDLLLAQSIARSGAPVFAYQFFHPPSDDPVNCLNLGCNTTGANVPCHSAEMPFVFSSQYFCANSTWTEEEVDLSFVMHPLWANFVKGNYSTAISTRSRTGQNIEWPLYRTANASIVFDAPTIGQINNFRMEQCNFWYQMGFIY